MTTTKKTTANPAPVAPAHPERLNLPALSELQTWSTDQLHDALSSLFTLSVEVLRYGADLWRVLEGRGEDMTRYTRDPQMLRVRQIALGVLLPEVIMRFGVNTTRANIVSRLLADDQRRVLSGTLPVGELKDGKFDTRESTVDEMTPEQLKLVFDAARGRIREPGEQRAILTAPASVPEWEPNKDEATVDKHHQTLCYGTVSIPLAVVLKALRKAGIKKTGG